MKPKIPLLLAAVAILALTCLPLFAHHGTGVAYETEKTVTLKGVVTEWIWPIPIAACCLTLPTIKALSYIGAPDSEIPTRSQALGSPRTYSSRATSYGYRPSGQIRRATHVRS